MSPVRWSPQDQRSTLRPMTPNRVSLVAVALVGVALTGCSGRAASSADPVLSPVRPTPPVVAVHVPESIPPSVDSVPAAPAATGSVLPPDPVVVGLQEVQQGVNECLRLPTRCDVSRWATGGSQAHRALAAVVRYYVSNSLVARIVPAVMYVVPERVVHVSPTRVEITLCEVDGGWQMDSRGTRRTDDDIVWNDLLVSRRARHSLVLRDGVWRRSEIVELEFWPGENRCPPSTAV